MSAMWFIEIVLDFLSSATWVREDLQSHSQQHGRCTSDFLGMQIAGKDQLHNRRKN